MDLVLCGHTIEDLKDPEPILIEMQRVGKQGFIECPSRLHEQTKGIRDRESVKAGHPHGYWIVESQDKELLLYSKQDSCLESESQVLPLSFTEKKGSHGWIGACSPTPLGEFHYLPHFHR